MECCGLFWVSTHELKALLHASLDMFSREEIWHVCLIGVVKDVGKSSELLHVEISVKHSMSLESTGKGVVTDTDLEIARTLGNRHVCPAYSIRIMVRLSGVVMLPP